MITDYFIVLSCIHTFNTKYQVLFKTRKKMVFFKHKRLPGEDDKKCVQTVLTNEEGDANDSVLY